MISKVYTYWNTVKYLRPIQLWSRLERKFKPNGRTSVESCPPVRDVHLYIPELDSDEEFCRKFRTEELRSGKVCLLNQMVEVDYSYAYTHSLKPLIHNNVYYFEYGVALAAEYRKTGDAQYAESFKRCYQAYLDSDANVKSSYIMSLHIPNLLIALDMFGDAIGEDFRQKVFCELYSMYQYLEQHLETHLLANHYFEDLKALTIASWLFGEDKKCRKYLHKLQSQVKEQILPDGLHYELSPMYHKLILEDLLRIAVLAEAPGFPEHDWLIRTVSEMTNAMASIENGFGRTPLFNDSGDNVAKSCESLIKASKRITGQDVRYDAKLESSGYYKMYDTDIAVVIDCGKVGVGYQPAHGHCDCLSFELSYLGEPLFVNQGTYEYQGDKRKYFKKTCAHNTVTVNGHEQNECWGGFRIGRRISAVSGDMRDSSFEGSYRNYCKEKHKREITLKGGVFSVLDFTEGNGKSYLHLAPGYEFSNKQITKDGKPVCSVDAVKCSVEYITEGELCDYAPGFGILEKGSCLVFSWNTDNDSHGYRIIFK